MTACNLGPTWLVEWHKAIDYTTLHNVHFFSSEKPDLYVDRYSGSPFDPHPTPIGEVRDLCCTCIETSYPTARVWHAMIGSRLYWVPILVRKTPSFLFTKPRAP